MLKILPVVASSKYINQEISRMHKSWSLEKPAEEPEIKLANIHDYWKSKEILW